MGCAGSVAASRQCHLQVGSPERLQLLLGPDWWVRRYILYQESLAERMPSPSEDAWPPTLMEDSPYGIISRKVVEVMMDEPAYKLYVSGHRRVLCRHTRSQPCGCWLRAGLMHLDSLPLPMGRQGGGADACKNWTLEGVWTRSVSLNESACSGVAWAPRWRTCSPRRCSSRRARPGTPPASRRAALPRCAPRGSPAWARTRTIRRWRRCSVTRATQPHTSEPIWHSSCLLHTCKPGHACAQPGLGGSAVHHRPFKSV